MFLNPFPKYKRICAKSNQRRFFAFSVLVAACVYGADKELGSGVNMAMVRGLRAVVNVGTNLSTCVVSINHLPDNNYRLRGQKIRFAFNNSDECSVEQTEDFSYEIDFYGYQYSEEKGDAYIVLETYNGEEVARVDLTVLWGEISMRCEQEGSFSSDNEALYTRHAMFLGLQHNWERHIPHGDYYSYLLEGYCNITTIP